MAGAMHLYAMALMTPALLSRQHFFMPSRLIVGAAVSVLLVGGMIVSSRAYLHSTLQDLLLEADVLNQMHSPITVSPATVYKEVPPAETDLSRFESRIDRIRADKVLRVGYHADNLPFSFYNEQGNLVGFDVDMAHLMAEDLGMQLVMVPFEFHTLADQLDRGDFDIAMSGISVTPTRLLRMSLSEPYMNSTLAFVVKDHLRREFSSSESLAELTDVTIAVPRSNYFESRLKKYLPQAKVVFIESPREFFVKGEMDAMLANAEAGSAWTIQYPSYAVAVPQPDVFTVPLGYAVPQGDSRLTEFVNQWIELKRGQPTYNTLYNHWIYGKDPTHNRPRWCVIRDVLHWVD
jgi:ABC-type amino acid transport substrate-binding protein